MNTRRPLFPQSLISLAASLSTIGRGQPFFAINDGTGAPPSGRQWFRVVRNEDTSKPVEILIYDQIGKNWWDDSGVGAKDFADALKAIPTNREIIVGINSPGGSVWDGLAIYHQLQARKDKVVCRVDGVAISAASFIACAGRELQMPKNTLMMIHEPAAMAAGNPEEIRKAADALDQHGVVIAGIYAAKTGKTMEEMRKMMRDETWFTGDEAKACGLCNTVTEEVAMAANFDFSKFRRVPKSLGKTAPTNSAAASSGAGDQTMTREQVIALLKKHGIKYAENATLAELIALLDKIPTASTTPPPANPAPAPAANGTPTPAPAPAGTPAPTAAAPSNDDGRIARLEQAYENERRTRITAAVDQCITECRIPVAQRASWVTRAMADEAVLNDLRAIPQNLPGSSPVTSVEPIGEDPRSIDKAVCALFGRHIGNASEAIERGRRRAEIIVENIGRILKVWNTNTISTDLKRTVILQQMIRNFAIRVLPLSAFSTRFDGIRLEGTNKVAVPYFALDTTASHDFVANDGYDTFGNTNADAKVIEVDQRIYQGLSWTSAELARQPYLDIAMSASLKAEQLGIDVVNDVLSLVDVATFGASVKSEGADAFDSDDVIELKGVADQANWPASGRSLLLNSTYDVNLLKDSAIKSALNFGDNAPIREGRITRLAGFDYFPDARIPDNGEYLQGMIAFKSGLLVAFAPIGPTPEVRQLLSRYEVVVEPTTGATFEYRLWGDPTKDTSKEIIEANYGRVAGEVTAIKRITSQ